MNSYVLQSPVSRDLKIEVRPGFYTPGTISFICPGRRSGTPGVRSTGESVSISNAEAVKFAHALLAMAGQMAATATVNLPAPQIGPFKVAQMVKATLAFPGMLNLGDQCEVQEVRGPAHEQQLKLYNHRSDTPLPGWFSFVAFQPCDTTKGIRRNDAPRIGFGGDRIENIIERGLMKHLKGGFVNVMVGSQAPTVIMGEQSEAQDEAKRLTEKSKGSTVLTLQVVAARRVKVVTTETVEAV